MLLLLVANERIMDFRKKFKLPEETIQTVAPLAAVHGEETEGAPPLTTGVGEDVR